MTMKQASNIQIPYSRSDLMIEPIGFCNLKCRYCYTKQGNRQLEKNDIITFVDKWMDFVNEPVEIFWIGCGEITLYPYLSELVNRFWCSLESYRAGFTVQDLQNLIKERIWHMPGK